MSKTASKQTREVEAADAVAAERQRLAELQERRAKLERRPEEIPGERQPLMHRIEVVVTPRRKSFATSSMTQQSPR